MYYLFQKLNLISLFRLVNLKFLDISPLSPWLVINTAEGLWYLSGNIFDLNFYPLNLSQLKVCVYGNEFSQEKMVIKLLLQSQ